MVARGVQNFGQNGPWRAGWLSGGQNFSVNFAQAHDEQMLKISERYLDSSLNNYWITENLLQQSASCQSFLVKVTNRMLIVATNFWLFSNYSKKNQDIFLKFSAFVHYVPVQNWQKILTITQSACPPQPILAKTLNASSDHICWYILKRKKLG